MKLMQDYLSFENDRAGIYRIDCLASGKFYIGSSKRLYKRFMDHQSSLRKSTHYNAHLQRSFDKYGDDSFTYTVLVVLPPSDRDFIYSIEKKFIDAYKPQLNILTEVGTPVAQQRAIACYSLEGKLIEVLPSLTDAATKYKAHSTGIRKATMDPHRVCVGLRWRYVDNEPVEDSIPDLKDLLSVSIDKNVVGHHTWKYAAYSIYQWTKSGELLQTWHSIEDACASISGASITSLREHIRGRLNSYFGYVWSLDPVFPGCRTRGEFARKPIILKKNGEILHFESTADAARHFGVSRGAITTAWRRGYDFRGWSIYYGQAYADVCAASTITDDATVQENTTITIGQA